MIAGIQSPLDRFQDRAVDYGGNTARCPENAQAGESETGQAMSTVDEIGVVEQHDQLLSRRWPGRNRPSAEASSGSRRRQ